MLSRSWWIAAGAFSAVMLLVSAAPPQDSEREARTRDYIKFLITELDQWTSDLPQTYDRALVRPPVDAGALSEAGKAAADNLRDSIKRLATLGSTQDVTANAVFRTQLEKTLEAAKAMNEALGAQRFPQAIEGDWVPIRTNLNSLADIYKLQELAALEIPGAGSGGGRKAGKVAAAIPAGAVTGYIVDQRCAARGKGMWTNVQCVQTCVRDGDRVVLVTEGGKVFQIANQDKVDQDAYGQKVAVTGKTEGDAITVATLQPL
jgi:hypothetical protein